MAIIETSRSQNQVGLLFIDLDNFKHFNDSMGHEFGDKLLVATAARLLSCARESDTVARLSGDEFTILHVSTNNCQGNLDVICNRIVESMKQPLHIMGREVFTTVSIGTTVGIGDSFDSTRLLAEADAAMYEAKRSGRNTFKHYVQGMNIYSIDRMTLETDLRMALERNEFELFYQPQIKPSTGNLIGCEALIRWRHPERGLLSPAHFIDILEETGLIVSVGKWVLQEACRQHMDWVNKGIKALSISINISAMQFYQTGFCEMVHSIISDSGIQPEYIEFELTESLFMHDVDTVLRILHDLRALGIKIAIDDFGTGYSNLGYLKLFPIDRLKIDQSFIRHLDSEPVNLDIVRAIVALGNSLSLKLVAEGVETENELALVSSSGCEFVQGFRYSKPLVSDQFEMWVKARKQ